LVFSLLVADLLTMKKKLPLRLPLLPLRLQLRLQQQHQLQQQPQKQKGLLRTNILALLKGHQLLLIQAGFLHHSVKPLNWQH
jgi:hypothetical protein